MPATANGLKGGFVRNGAALAPAVSIVIGARNNGQFLRDAINSCFAQTVKPVDVIYADDGSEDTSLEVAKSFPPGSVIILPGGHQGAAAARNRGLAAAKGDWVIFLDGDDILPNNYVEKKLDALRACPDADFVFSPAQAFGDTCFFWEVPPWSYQRLWNGNYVNTSSMFRKQALNKIGGWREIVGPNWDWDLALRLGKARCKGTPGRGYLLYRQHQASVSHQNWFRDAWKGGTNAYLMRVCHAAITVGAIVSGRILGMFSTWLEVLGRNVRAYKELVRADVPPRGNVMVWPPIKLSIIYTGDPSQRARIMKAIDVHTNDFDAVSFRVLPWTNNYAHEQQRRDNVSRFLADTYNLLGDDDCSELLWLVEDDVLPPDNCLYRLVRSVFFRDGPFCRFAAAGVYRNRHVPEEVVVHNWPNPPKVEGIEAFKQAPNFGQDCYVDLAGTGCMLINRVFATHRFGSHVGPVAAHDWNWCIGLRQHTQEWMPPERRVFLPANLFCKHYTTPREFLAP